MKIQKLRLGVIDVDPNNLRINYNKKTIIDKIQEYDLPLIPIESKSGGLHLLLYSSKEFYESAKEIVSFPKRISSPYLN